jgi:exocyst complex component 2
LFEKCTIAHEARMEVLQNKIREKMLSDSKWRQLQQDSNKSVSKTTFHSNKLTLLVVFE